MGTVLHENGGVPRPLPIYNRRTFRDFPLGTMGLTSGSRLGPYEIVSVLGAGGMGEVYRARDSRLSRWVAAGSCPPDQNPILFLIEPAK
jgi:serine/threonine protein kinase